MDEIDIINSSQACKRFRDGDAESWVIPFAFAHSQYNRPCERAQELS